MTDVTFAWSGDRSRFGAHLVGAEPGAVAVAFAAVHWANQTLVVEHTETDPAHQGEGLAGRLTRALLDDARENGWRVDPQCPYTADWIDRHPDYADLVAPA